MDILFVNPNYEEPTNHPWGVLNLASYLRTVQGFRLELIDASIVGTEAAMARVRQLLPRTDLIGIGFMSIGAPFAKAVADMVKAEKPSCRIVVGGPHPILLPEQTVEYTNFDFVAYTEAEVTVTRLIEELRRPDPDLSRVPGLLYRKEGIPQRTAVPDLEPFYDIDYTLLDDSVQSAYGDYIQVFTGNGCSFKCTFCFNAICGNAWRGRPLPEVFAELDKLVSLHDPTTIYFRDENFFHDKSRVLEFIELYHQHGFRFKWRALCRAGYFNPKYMDTALVKKLAAAGCACLKFGFESGSDRTLKNLKKGIRVKNIERVLEVARQVPEIHFVGNFLMGLPDETPADYHATLNLIGRVRREIPNLEVVGPHYYRIYPGGELYNRVISEFGFSAPSSFEEWVERYDDDVNRGAMGGFADTNVHYPWVPDSCEFLARNAALLVRLTRDDFLGKQPPYKRWLFWCLQRMAWLRFRLGWYSGLLDLRLAIVLEQSSLLTVIARTRTYRVIRSAGWYNSLRRTRSFGFLRRFLHRPGTSAGA